jgi:hypothetical protein
MIDIGIAVTGGVFYLTGRYNMALLLLVLAIISGAGATIMSVVNPDWYFQRRIQAGLEVDLFNPGKAIRSLLVTKAIVIGLEVWAAYYVAQTAGYL